MDTDPSASQREAPPEGAPPEPAPAAAANHTGPELFEAEHDFTSVQTLKDLFAKLGEVPGLKGLVETWKEVGVEGLRQQVSRLLAAPADRPIDKFGFDRLFYDELYPLARFFHDKYFRVESTGVEHIPASGRVLVVANHSGTLPYDGAMVVTTVRIHHPAERLLRPLVENFVYYMPYLGRFMARAGAVRACQENATALLESDEAVLVFPEGVKGVGKLYRKRYRLQRFGRGGAVKLALSTGAPIVPCSIVGAEEAMPLLGKVTFLAGPLGIPYIPVTPTLPLLGPLGLVPYPTKWFIDFGEPIDVAGYGKNAVNDRVLVNRLNEEIRDRIQNLIDDRLARRQSVFFG